VFEERKAHTSLTDPMGRRLVHDELDWNGTVFRAIRSGIARNTVLSYRQNVAASLRRQNLEGISLAEGQTYLCVVRRLAAASTLLREGLEPNPAVCSSRGSTGPPARPPEPNRVGQRPSSP